MYIFLILLVTPISPFFIVHTAYTELTWVSARPYTLRVTTGYYIRILIVCQTSVIMVSYNYSSFSAKFPFSTKFYRRFIHHSNTSDSSRYSTCSCSAAKARYDSKNGTRLFPSKRRRRYSESWYRQSSHGDLRCVIFSSTESSKYCTKGMRKGSDGGFLYSAHHVNIARVKLIGISSYQGHTLCRFPRSASTLRNNNYCITAYQIHV